MNTYLRYFLILLSLSLAGKLSATPIMGENLYYSGGELKFSILESNSSYYSELSLYASLGDPALDVLGMNNELGKTGSINPGGYGLNVGDELVFGITVFNTGQQFFSGAADRNPDGRAHAAFESLADGSFIVSFDDYFGGSTMMFEGFQFSLAGGVSAGGITSVTTVSEPSMSLLLVLGVGVMAFRRWRRRLLAH